MADEQRQWRLSEQRTPAGHPADLMASLLQKACRRSEEELAIYAAMELFDAGFGSYAMRRCRVVASEDVSVADAMTVILVGTLSAWFEEAKRSKKLGDCKLHLTAAVMALCRARKSRVTDDALAVFGDAARRVAMRVNIDQVAPWSVDHHTARGRALGRTEADCYEDSYRIEKAALEVDNPYAQEARRIYGAPPLPDTQE